MMDFTHILTDPYTQVVSSFLAFAFVILSLYYGLFYMRVGRSKGTGTKKNAAPASPALPPVSVVMTVQNDADNLKANLLYLLEQDYPDFEVVVVDYLSTDDTVFTLKILSENYKHLKVVTFRENASGYQGRKYPLSIGIKSAANDILLFTEPDCMPADTTNFGWIREMVKGYVHKNIDIVLGYCAIQSKASLFNWLQQYDNLDYSSEYLAAALLRHPFSGNGRNLSYRRSLFLKNGGFIYHYHIPDGADDMFVNQNSRRRNTSVVLTPESFTSVPPCATLAQWHDYRKRRVSTHAFYGLGLKISRMVRPLNVLVFYLAAVLLFVGGKFPWQILAAVLLLKLAWQIVATAKAARRLSVRPVVYWLSPLFEIYFLIANTIFAIVPLSKKK